MRILGVLLVCVALASGFAAAQDIKEERVRFEAGESDATISGRIKGYESVDYLVGAKAGQQISISFKTSNLSAYFNLLAGDDPTAIHTGSIDGNVYKGKLSADGDYRIRVYLMRNAARRDETAKYSLTVAITGKASETSGSGDFADGLMGGPDYWAVSGVPANDTLNIRAGAGTGEAVIGEVANGDIVRNLGCKMAGSAKWCQVEVGGDQKFSGWTNGKYLIEASGAPQDGPGKSEATGEIPCATAAGQPTMPCAFRVERRGKGDAFVWITLPSGGERLIDFRAGKPANTDSGKDFSFEKSGDLFLIRVGDAERYQIPDAVVFGG